MRTIVNGRDIRRTGVGYLADGYFSAAEVGEENICDHVTVGEDDGGRIPVTMVEIIRWSEFEIGPWARATVRQLDAVKRTICVNYGAAGVNHRDEDFTGDGLLEVEWVAWAEGHKPLGEVLDFIRRIVPEGPVGFHNNSNGAYGATGNVVREVREAVAAVEG
ncbi:hypothetical protein [Micromonospora sp. NPDC047730]|uniref:hypothetical protein n=1 Tax=Micromonospora sp. NPDC047730 TaxID=3364253 RepID=UPI003716BA14